MTLTSWPDPGLFVIAFDWAEVVPSNPSEAKIFAFGLTVG